MQLNGAEMPEIVSKGYSNALNIVMQKCLQKETWDRFSAESLMEFPKVKKLDEKIKAEEENKTISRDTIIKNVIAETATDKTEEQQGEQIITNPINDVNSNRKGKVKKILFSVLLIIVGIIGIVLLIKYKMAWDDMNTYLGYCHQVENIISD